MCGCSRSGDQISYNDNLTPPLSAPSSVQSTRHAAHEPTCHDTAAATGHGRQLESLLKVAIAGDDPDSFTGAEHDDY